jgi:hypothetical protein
VYSFGTGNYGTPYTLCIAPQFGFTSESNNRNVTESISEETGTTIFPNPAQMNCSISSNKAIQRIRVYDLSSRKVEDIFVNGNLRYELNTSNYSNGIFHDEIQTEEKTEVKKLIVSH